MIALYANQGNGLFIDEAPSSAIGKASLLTLTFACFFFDADLDGQAGHLRRQRPRGRRHQPPCSRRSPTPSRPISSETSAAAGSRRSRAAVGAALNQPVVARGAAYGDFDNDGDLDVLETTNNGPARLLRNDGGNRNHMLRVRTVGTQSNRDGIGARVTVTLDSGQKRWAHGEVGIELSARRASCRSPSALGRGQGEGRRGVVAERPRRHVAGVAAGQTITIQEGKGVC